MPASRIGFGRDQPVTEGGEVGFISQSGGHASRFIRRTAESEVKISKLVSLGNASDLKITDFLLYFGRDLETKIIGLYIEGISEGRRFFETLRDVASRKPVVIWKGGRTESGMRATRGHTGSLAGSFDIWKSVSKQTGAILVENVDEIVDTIVALRSIRSPKRLRVALLGGGGGESVEASDALGTEGLTIPPLARESEEKITQILPPAGTIRRNPIDMNMGPINSHYLGRMKELLTALAEDPNIDTIIFHEEVSLPGQWGGAPSNRTAEEEIQSLAETLAEFQRSVTKPILCVIQKRSEGVDLEEALIITRRIFRQHGLPPFPSMTRAARVIRRLHDYHRFFDRED
ncbi:MAG: hypothetical protein HY731_03340 [Candidatus Tectomicrobia bacterium]|nr:hypothetical protein [Candidatus Tectomicrobia bacterium]